MLALASSMVIRLGLASDWEFVRECFGGSELRWDVAFSEVTKAGGHIARGVAIRSVIWLFWEVIWPIPTPAALRSATATLLRSV